MRTQPNRSLTLSLLILFCGLLWGAAMATNAVAQVAADDVRQVLERTEEVLQEVQAVVGDSDSDQARRILADALTKQHQARVLFENDRLGFAARLSLRAREIARQAERIARGSLNFEERARQYVDRVRELHDDVKARVRETHNEQALRFVTNAERLMFQSREQYRQTRYKAAFRLLQQAEKSLKRAARLLFDAGDADHLEQELGRTADLIALARERLASGGDQALPTALDQAEQALQEAREAMSAGEPLLALRRGRHARRLAQRVMRQTSAAPGSATVANEVERFEQGQGDLSERAAQARNATAARTLVRAKELHDRAASALHEGRSEEALRFIRSALNLQRQAAEQLR